MISQIIPSSVDVHGSVAVLLRPNGDGSLSDARVLNGSSGSREDLGPLCLALHQPAGCQGSRVDPGIVPVGAGTRWFRRFVRVPVPVFGSARLWRPRPFERDRRSFGPLSPYSEERDAYAATLYGESEVLKVDGEGRVILNDGMKARVSITNEVTFVGQGHKFQIWEPGRFRAHLEEARNRVRNLRKQLSSGQAATGASSPQPPGARD